MYGARLTEDRFGNANSAYRFDGISDYISFGSDPSTHLLGDMSVSVWVKMGTIPSWFGPVVARGEWGEEEEVNNVFNVHIMNVDREPFLRHSHESGAGANTDLTSTRVIEEMGWIHLGVVRNAEDKYYRFFLNGEAEADIPYTTGPTGGQEAPGYIGWAPWGVTTFFRGFIDDIRIYNSAKSNAEMFALCHEGGWTVSVEDPSVELPNGYYLGQNYPNPFNPTTRIEFSLPESSHITIEVFDILGRSIRRMIDAPLLAGDHSVIFEADGLPTGTYLYRIETKNFSKSLRMTVLK